MQSAAYIPVSVVIPCYRCSLTLGRAISSIAHQSMLPSEIILVDDFSDDGGKTRNAIEDVISRYPQLNIATVFLGKNMGPGEARNIGWNKAKGLYIAFLDADDSWSESKLEIQYEWMMKHPDVDLTGHLSVRLNEFDKTFSGKFCGYKQVFFKGLLLVNSLPTRSVMIKRSITERFPKKYQAEDYLLWLNIAFNNKKIYLLKIVLAFSYKRNFGESGLSENLKDSFRNILDVYQQLKQERKISLMIYWFLVNLAYLKHLRRSLLSKFINQSFSH